MIYAVPEHVLEKSDALAREGRIIGGAWRRRISITATHRKLVAQNHPDRGGSHDAMAEVNAARDTGLRERTLK